MSRHLLEIKWILDIRKILSSWKGSVTGIRKKRDFLGVSALSTGYAMILSLCIFCYCYSSISICKKWFLTVRTNTHWVLCKCACLHLCTTDFFLKSKSFLEKNLGMVDIYSFAKEKDKRKSLKNHFTQGKKTNPLCPHSPYEG